MSANDLKSRTPEPLDTASHTFVDRISRRKQGIGGTASDTADPDAEIDDTSLPLDNRSDGTVSQAVEDVDDGNENRPDANNPDNAGEDESVVR